MGTVVRIYFPTVFVFLNYKFGTFIVFGTESCYFGIIEIQNLCRFFSSSINSNYILIKLPTQSATSQR